jgi:hypothetical protein
VTGTVRGIAAPPVEYPDGLVVEELVVMFELRTVLQLYATVFVAIAREAESVVSRLPRKSTPL